MTESLQQPSETPAVIIVSCPDTGRVGCEIVRRAVALVVAETPEAMVAGPEQARRNAGEFILAVDGSSACRAAAALEARGIRPSAVISAPQVLARAGLVRPGVEVRARLDELAEALAQGIRESLREVLEEARERRRYRQEMEPILERFRGIWGSVETLGPPPDGVPAEQERRRVDLLGKRCRNLFTKFDEIVPPSQWAEPHDLFQDALLCIAYACEGWASSDARRWEQNLEKARVQMRPLLRRLQ